MIRVLALLLMLLPGAVWAHKVIVSVYAAGDMIEGEIGLSSGAMAGDVVVEVFDADGTKLGETVTDADGFFTYRPEQAVALHFRADLGSGHVAQAVMPVEDLPEGLRAAPAGAVPVAAQTSAAAPVAAVDEARIAEIVRDELRPLRREIAAMKDETDLRDILGGLGFIAGLFGAGFYIAARRRMTGQGDG
ncbi:cobalt ABC transporter permease [Marimonas lutisalis]|uniref:cobalt ABC transporter permease n=1 Tax=Marimonas lutisalis TaxID=2545756 RepID=UPI0013757D9C|nr:cobalt ABC transporter permease [Marimonas lutisalis]